MEQPVEEFIQSRSHGSIPSNEKPRKFQSLTIDGSYKVLGYSPTFNKSYILSIKDINTDEEFEIYSTYKLTECIEDSNFPKAGGFNFLC